MIQPAAQNATGHVVIGGTYHLRRDGLPQTDSRYSEHADHPLTVTRELRADECDREEVGRMYEVSAPDGWSGSVFADELVPVGTDHAVTPRGGWGAAQAKPRGERPTGGEGTEKGEPMSTQAAERPARDGAPATRGRTHLAGAEPADRSRRGRAACLRVRDRRAAAERAPETGWRAGDAYTLPRGWEWSDIARLRAEQDATLPDLVPIHFGGAAVAWVVFLPTDAARMRRVRLLTEPPRVSGRGRAARRLSARRATGGEVLAGETRPAQLPRCEEPGCDRPRGHDTTGPGAGHGRIVPFVEDSGIDAA